MITTQSEPRAGSRREVEVKEPPPTSPAVLPVSQINLTRFTRQLLVAFLALAFCVVVVLILREFAVVLRPLVIAVFLGYLVIPVYRWISLRTNSYFAGLLVTLVILALFIGLGMILYNNVARVLERWSELQARVNRAVDPLANSIPVTWQVGLRESVQVTDEQIHEASVIIFGTFVGFLHAAIAVLLYLLFLFAERNSFPRRLINAFGPEKAARVGEVLTKISNAITKYISVKTFVSLLVGMVTTVMMVLFGVDYAIATGTIAFLLNFIPYLGPLVATVLPVALAILAYDSLWGPLALGAILLFSHEVIGMYIETVLTGSRLNLSPLLVILSLAFWGMIWGGVGMVVAVPILVSLKIVLEHIPATVPLARLMAGS